jgi:hypothetical protein
MSCRQKGTGLIVDRAALAAKRIMRSVGLGRPQSNLDFSSRLTSAKHVDATLTRIADVMQEWLSRQSIFPDLIPFDVRQEVRGFYASYLSSPFRDRTGNGRFNKILWLTVLAKALRPTLIIDSGTYAGASAWALSHGAPHTKILSFDVDLSRLRLRQPNCEYFQYDWSKHDFANFDLSRSLCYFDDLTDQVRRILEAKGRGIPFALFNDDLPLSFFANMTPSPNRLPKLEFIDDPLLEHGEVVEWIWNGAPRRWIVDQTYLARGRAAIKAAERLPDLGMLTGIHVLSPKAIAL